MIRCFRTFTKHAKRDRSAAFFDLEAPEKVLEALDGIYELLIGRSWASPALEVVEYFNDQCDGPHEGFSFVSMDMFLFHVSVRQVQCCVQCSIALLIVTYFNW